ncbi:MAG: hypothetical protein HN509_12190 [Halobacteriovoraceae bacterium]|jgi:putative hydrolase|nr:hypothetical protein [Halobacteriovoraceae bacterium]
MIAKDLIINANQLERDNIPLWDLHMHTTWTDGAQSAKEMHQAAIRSGLNYILFSEHARKSSGDWFPKFAQEVRFLEQDICKAFVGLETKVSDFKGSLDTTPEILSECDLVMASVHRFPGEEGVVKGFGETDPSESIKIETDLSLAVLENSDCDILGHPLGMSLRRFGQKPTIEDFRVIVKKAAKTGVAFEINSHYHPDPWMLIELCQEEGANISLGSNAHNVSEVGSINRILKGEEKAWQN